MLKRDHREWYAKLFAPAVAAGILKRHQLAGYRTGPIFIRNSMHTPLPRDALLDSMEELFRLVAEEPEASVRAVLGTTSSCLFIRISTAMAVSVGS